MTDPFIFARIFKEPVFFARRATVPTASTVVRRYRIGSGPAGPAYRGSVPVCNQLRRAAVALALGFSAGI